MKGLKNKKFVIVVVSLTLLFFVSSCGCSFKKETVNVEQETEVEVNKDTSDGEVVLEQKVEIELVTNNDKTEEPEKEVVVEESIGEQIYDLDVQVEKIATTEIVGEYDKESTSVICKVTAPNVYQYLMDNMQMLNELEVEELYQTIMQYIQSEECEKRIVEVELPAQLQDGKLVVDATTVEYQDAIHGGMNSALTEIYILFLSELEKLME